MFQRKNIILLIFLSINIRSYFSKRHVGLINGDKNRVTLTVRHGDTIEYICPYNYDGVIKDGKIEDDNYMDNREFCFNYVVINKDVRNLREHIRGSYNITSKEEDNMYKAEFTLPPVVLSNRSFDCYCYMELNGEVLKKVLRVNIISSPMRKIPGCDFNMGVRSSYVITTNSIDYHRTKYCEIYPNSGDYIGLLCPEYYSAKPDSCFSKIYTLKDNPSDEKEQQERTKMKIWDESKFKEVDMNTLLKTDIVTYGDERSKFAEMPNVNEKATFTCICEANNKSDNLMMHVYFNQKEKRPSNIIHRTRTYSSVTSVKKINIRENSSSFSRFISLSFLLFLFFFTFF